MNFKHALHCLIGGLFLSLTTTSHAEVEMLDRIISIVDQKTISQSELDSRLNEVIKRSRAANVNLPPLSVIREQVLDQLISETLQLNEAERYSVQITDEEVIESIKGIMAERKINQTQLIQGLAAEGVTLNEFKENLRRQLTLQTIAQGIVSSRIRVSEKDIDNFLQSADAKFWISPQYHLQHILIPIEGSGTAAVSDAQEKAKATYDKLINGANFSAIAIAESKGPSALKGGDLGLRKTSEMPSLFAEQAPKLDINGISEPFRSRAGFHILKLLDKRGETKQVVTQSHVRHILIELSEILDQNQAKEKILKLKERIVAGEDFADLAKQYTQDIGSKMSGGELGWSRPGMFVPEFEKVMNELPVGEISAPVLSQFGWHIIQVTERREEDLSDDLIRQRARHQLIGRRFEDEVQLWLQEMRDEAFIETKI